MPTPHKENLRRWVAALRSGKYRQGCGSLNMGDGYCCLGVACDLHAQEYGLQWVPDGTWLGRRSYLGDDMTLPFSVQEWLGLESTDPVMHRFRDEYEADGKPMLHMELSWLNDRRKMTFNEIADVIEEEYNLRQP